MFLNGAFGANATGCRCGLQNRWFWLVLMRLGAAVAFKMDGSDWCSCDRVPLWPSKWMALVLIRIVQLLSYSKYSLHRLYPPVPTRFVPRQQAAAAPPHNTHRNNYPILLVSGQHPHSRAHPILRFRPRGHPYPSNGVSYFQFAALSELLLPCNSVFEGRPS